MDIDLRLCSSPESSLTALTEICAWADELRLAYAWATSNAGHAAHWKVLPLENLRQATVGIHFAQTEPAVLSAFLACGDGILKVIEDTGGVFHPKVLVGIRGRKVRALIGSSNFTTGGFSGNTELNVVLEGTIGLAPIDEVLRFVDAQWNHPRAFKPDKEWLARYERAYKSRPRPKPVPRGKVSVEKVVLRQETDLDLDWGEYYALIAQQERRSLSNGYTIHVFDHPDASYLQEIEQCQAAFHRYPSFEKMPLDERKFVAGFGGTSGYFGRMVGAGYFKNMICESPRDIAPLLNAVPLDGQPSDAQILKYLSGAIAIHGVSLATATRLLIAKRPDLFFSVNGANRNRVKAIFGKAPTRPESYLQLLKRLWSTPWFQSPEPAADHERRIWRVRVAILDAVMYDAT